MPLEPNFSLILAIISAKNLREREREKIFFAKPKIQAELFSFVVHRNFFSARG